MLPDFVAENIKSLFTASRWMSEPVVSVPMTALLGRVNTFTSAIIEIDKSCHDDQIVTKLVINEKMRITFPDIPSTNEPPAYTTFFCTWRE